MEKNGLLILLLAALCALASGHFRKYHFVNDEKSWSEAQRYCRVHHTDLATIESQEEAGNLLNTKDNNNQKAWIGLYRGVEKNWQWSNSDAVIINKLEHEQDIIKKSCVEFDKDKWTNEQCSKKNSFMCYKECSNSSKIYFLIEEGKTWTEAQQYCREHHTDLVSIKSASENEDLVKKAQGKPFWIGLFNNPWKWSDGGDFDFQNWNSGKPSGDENEKCVSIHRNEGTWKDEKCDTELPFFCYDDDKFTKSQEEICRLGIPSPTHHNDKFTKSQEEICRLGIPSPTHHISGLAIMEKLVLLMLLLAGICAVAAGHFRKYHFVKDEKSWFDAQSYCREKHTDLATIESQEETEKVLNISAGFTDAWIGLYYDKENWQWSNGDNVSYYNWTSSLNCTSVDSKGEWVDSDCNKTTYSFICYNGICAVAAGHFRKYHFVKDEKSWFDAQSYCREKHTDLATIESQEETEKVLNISAGFTDAWIGLYYDKENWQWSNGDNVSYYNWASSLNCTSVNSDGEWVDSDCNKTTYSFICYNETRESYILIDHPKTWYEAQQYCRENYTDLVSIKNNDEDKKIKEEAKGSAVWIGLFNNPWKWSHKGEYSSFHNWNKGEPNNVGNNICVEMYGTDKKERVKWNDAGCNYTLPFFCYKESCKDTSCTKYHFEKTAMNWSAAQTHCRDKYTDLATVHSQEEVKQLDHFNISTNAWIGMYRDVSENWQWSNGDEVTYNTRRGKLFCVTVNPDRDWTDSVCHDKKHFMCYNSSKGICAVASGLFRKYHFVKDEKSWFDAQSYCRENHTDLATIESQAETEKLNISAGFTNAWIGLYYDKENWQWSNGDNVSYYNWTSSLSCTSVDSNGEWVDSDCHSNRYFFICYNETRESYILIDHPKTWYEAQQYCRENYTDLVSIKNNDEDKKIKEKSNGTAVWIGLFNNPWKWSHKGEYSSFHNWDKGEPNNVGNNFCVEMYGKANKQRESCKDTSCTKYHFEKTAMNWSAAQTHCRDKYTDLATVHSQEEVKQLDHFNISTNAWIGMYRDVSENWQWSNGDEVTYNTRRGKLFCVTVNPDRDWTDSVCHDKKHFMCYNSSKGIFFSVMLYVMRCIDHNLAKQTFRSA
ncbi:UNVERIFIED_CONTAM: hypothetical protein FKN15_030372 [Acipenser sinensis]